ncbi:hypothetical protein PVAP13_1KG010601 [Panicum virgatum]|uniref:Uncharacterized protein n=1 Tax=Panicum virgatum TaxID=38727 RepID=A0A8T0X0W8_PANVG|nr:hypothetical protein PVAP13_1KG010601 [Panicum virgatum]
MERCSRVLGWLLAEGLAGSWPPAPTRTTERCSGCPRLGPSRWSSAEVTSTGERPSCRPKTGEGSGPPAAGTSRSWKRRCSGSPGPCSDSPILGGGQLYWCRDLQICNPDDSHRRQRC